MINSKRKGKVGELELVKEIEKHGYSARRGQQYDGLGRADVIGLIGVHTECKRVQALNIDKAMEQAIKDKKMGEIPTVFHRKNGKDWLVTMGIEDWFKLYDAWLDATIPVINDDLKGKIISKKED